MHVAQVERYGLKGQIDLTRHQVQVVQVRRQSEVCIGATLIRCHDETAVLNLELHQTQARSLIALGIRGAQEQHIVLAAALLPVDLGDKRGQFLKISGVTVDKCLTAIAPPTARRS